MRAYFLTMFKLGRKVISVWLFRIACFYISKIIYAEEKFENMLENVLYQDYVKKESKGIWKLLFNLSRRVTRTTAGHS